MPASNIELKSINQLLDFDFIIPSYQRGFRWNETQIIDLLNDIKDFIDQKEKKDVYVGDFYCLQPVIIKKVDGNKFRLIDGQQRLTTIYIILSFLKRRRFSLDFETRQKSKSFLENISDEINSENIDFYHISKAYQYIKDWFESASANEETLEDEFFINLGKYTKVIWYEISKDEEEIDVFARINSGKIPLTNAELIKALFLNRKNFNTDDSLLKQIEISKEWDEIEFSLQSNEFWYFLNKEKEYPTRIEILFEVFSEKLLNDEFSTYRYFSKLDNIVGTWAEENENIKKIFLSFKYWFDNRKLYHLIGYLISTKTYTIKSIYQIFRSKRKTEFEEELIRLVKANINLNSIDSLDYDSNSQEIFRILLLFNIATILNNSDSYIRFAFDKFNNEKWSLEHIHAQQDKGLISTEAIKNWLQDASDQLVLYNSNSDEDKVRKDTIIQEIQELKSQDVINRSDTKFFKVQNRIFEYFGDPDINTIDNLALLSSSVNSSLSNNIFPIKRKILIQKDMNGEFIPLCTKNVFLKYYSKNINNLFFWNHNDRRDYLSEMKSILESF